MNTPQIPKKIIAAQKRVGRSSADSFRCEVSAENIEEFIEDRGGDRDWNLSDEANEWLRKLWLRGLSEDERQRLRGEMVDISQAAEAAELRSFVE